MQESAGAWSSTSAGGVSSMISGIGIFSPDKRPTQRVGIVPDVEVRPTIAGIRDGRDEVLEAGIRQILGPGVPLSEIQKLIAGAREIVFQKERVLPFVCLVTQRN
jgi:hypothetical protein